MEVTKEQLAMLVTVTSVGTIDTMMGMASPKDAYLTAYKDTLEFIEEHNIIEEAQKMFDAFTSDKPLEIEEE